MTIPFEIAFESATPRRCSEDRGLVLPEKGVFAVFDGMGGGADADVAAEIACSHIAAASLKLTIPSSGDAFHEIIASLLCSASDAVYAHALVHGNDAATTASLCILVPLAEGGVMAGIGNVGDSRVYTLDKTGTLTQATLDDGPIRYAMMNGSEAGMRAVQTRLNNARGPSMLSSDERSLFSGRHLMTQVLGDKVIEPRVTTCMLQDGWTVILMTDGVHDNLTDDEIGDILRGAVGSADAAATLLAHARQRMDEGGFRSHLDDMAVIVVTSGNGGAPKLHVLESEGAVPSGNSGRLPRVQSRE